MFIAIAVCVSLVSTVCELLFIANDKSFKELVRVVFRNLFAISIGALALQKYVMKYAHFIDTSGYVKRDFISFLFVSICFALAFEIVVLWINKSKHFPLADKPKKRGGALALKIASVVIFSIGAAALFGSIWGGIQFGNVTGDQLIINLTSPTEGTEAGIYIDGFENGVFPTVLAVTYFSLVVFSKYRITVGRKKNVNLVNEFPKRIFCFLLAIGMASYGISYGFAQFSLDQVFRAYALRSDIIDSNYVDPETVNIQFPEKKRNLIHIYLESMENSYMSGEYGGFMEENLIPNLTAIGEEGIVFSDTDKYFGGPQWATGTQWSIASMINQTTGLPMKTPGVHNAYGVKGNFLPGAYTLGEILEKQGYEQSMMIGASATFGGLRYYYETHGNWKIMDYDYAINNGLIPSGYSVWWGYEDDKLYEFAKDEITRLYNTGKPFNFTMENADTHKPGGYITPGKETPFESKYANAIWNSDRDVSEFIRWIQAQPFYENTTVIIIGDHLSMDHKFFNEDYHFGNYKRIQYNAILNPAPSVSNPPESITNNRLWANWDMFPTIIASIGGSIDGERLGIGTNLFSGKQTVFEQYGVKKVNKELEKGSKLYNEKILQSSKLSDTVRARNRKKHR